MDQRVGFMVIVEILLTAVTSSGTPLEADPLILGDLPSSDIYRQTPALLEGWGYRSPEFYPQTLTPSERWDYAYTEVVTPYYHYYFYAPAFKTFSQKDPRVLPAPGGYVSPVPRGKAWQVPQETDRYSGDGYYSPQFNDVRYPSHEISTHNPKYHRNYFLEKSYSTSFNNPQHSYSVREPTLYVTPHFLPTVLSSGTSSIIRKEGQSRSVHDSVFRPFSYASSFKDYFSEPRAPPQKPVLSSSLFTSATPNIIRDEESPVSKLFKPVSPTYASSLFRTPTSRTPTMGVDHYHSLTSHTASALPTYSSTPFRTPTGEVDHYHSLTSPTASALPTYASTPFRTPTGEEDHYHSLTSPTASALPTYARTPFRTPTGEEDHYHSLTSPTSSALPTYASTPFRTPTGEVDGYHPLTTASPPSSIQTTELPGLPADDTLSPLFTPLQGFTTPSPNPSNSPTVVFEAPGHTHPRR